MPTSPPRICSRCRGTKPGTCKCAVRGPDRRESAAKRGYTWEWRQFARRYLAENPLCVDCLPKAVSATEVHHVKKLKDHPEFKYNTDWLMALCKSCHSIRTDRGE